LRVTIEDPKDFVGTSFSEEEDVVRSKGLHLSTIIDSIENDAGRSKKRADLTPSDLENYRALGFAWERVLSWTLTKINQNVVRPGEQFLDGVYMTPDGINLHSGKLEEWKCTWTSSRKDVPERWFTQVKGYLKALKMLEATIRVFYVCGTWNPPIPAVKILQLEFSQREIDENWGMIIQHAKSKGWL
jgi:hypothetical protein